MQATVPRSPPDQGRGLVPHLPVLSEWAAGLGMDPHCSGGAGPPATWPVWPGSQGLGCVSFSSGPPALQGPHLPGRWGSWLLHQLFNNYKGFSDFIVGERELPQARWLTKSRQIIQRTASRLALKPITPVGNKGTDVSNHHKKKKKVSICESESGSALSSSLQPRGSYSPGNSPGQNTGVGSLSLLQGIFPTQESNRGLLHCRQILY